MIISFTKDSARIFNLTLKTAHSEKHLNSLLLDDWVMGVIFTKEDSTGVYLIHRHSLLTLFVVAAKPDLTLCMNLLYEQLITILEKSHLSDAKYVNYFDSLFYELISVRHDNHAVSREIGNLKDSFYWFNNETRKAKQKIRSIDFVNKVNDQIHAKFSFKTSLEVFCELVEKYHSDPILITDNHPDYEVNNKVSIH